MSTKTFDPHTVGLVMSEVIKERFAQDETWGEQNHPDGTGLDGDRKAADAARARCKRAAVLGQDTWRLILDEEVQEAFAEADPAILRVELIQVAAVAMAWAQAIDRRIGES